MGLCTGPEGDTEGGDLTEREGRALDRLVERIQDSATALWLLGGSMTAMGRIFADVHWCALRIMRMKRACRLSNGFLQHKQAAAG